METKKLGKTDVAIPVIGMGTWRLGGEYTADYTDDEKVIRSLQAGIELGLTLIDTSEMYGAGHSEELVGKAIQGIREKVFIATKVKLEHLSSDGLLKAAEASLKRLGTDYIDLYQIPRPNPDIPLSETMEAVEKLVDDGKVRFIGLSVYWSTKMVRWAQKSLSQHEIVSDQVEYSLQRRRITRYLLPFAQREKITIITYTPFGRPAQPRYAFGTGYLLHTPSPGKKILESLARKYSKTPAQIALNWLIAQEPVVVIPKALGVTHLKENADATGWRMEAEDYQILDDAFRR